MKLLKQTQNDWMIRKVYLIGESKSYYSHKIKIDQTLLNNGNTIISTNLKTYYYEYKIRKNTKECILRQY